MSEVTFVKLKKGDFMNRTSWVFFSMTMLLGATSCELVPYNCVVTCNEHKDNIVRVGRDPRTGNAGVPESEACTHDEITAATNCGECVDAITSLYRVFTPEIGCHCPAASSNEGRTFTYLDRSCEQQELEVNQANCSTYEFDQHADPNQCFL